MHNLKVDQNQINASMDLLNLYSTLGPWWNLAKVPILSNVSTCSGHFRTKKSKDKFRDYSGCQTSTSVNSELINNY